MVQRIVVAVTCAGLVVACAPSLEGIEGEIIDAKATLERAGDHDTLEGRFLLSIRRPGSDNETGRVLIDEVTLNAGAFGVVSAHTIESSEPLPLELGSEEVTLDVRFFGQAPPTDITADTLCEADEEDTPVLSVKLYDEAGVPDHTPAGERSHALVVEASTSLEERRPLSIPEPVEAVWRFPIDSGGDDSVSQLATDGEVTSVLMRASKSFELGGREGSGTLVLRLDDVGEPRWIAPVAGGLLVTTAGGDTWVSSQSAVVRLDSDGAVLWQQSLTGAGPRVDALQADADGTVLVLSSDPLDLDRQYTLALWGTDATVIWSHDLGNVWPVEIRRDGDWIWISGSASEEPLPFDPSGAPQSTSFVAAMTIDGEAAWVQPVDCHVSAIAPLPRLGSLALQCPERWLEMDRQGQVLATHPITATGKLMGVDDRGHLWFSGTGQVHEQAFDELIAYPLACSAIAQLAISPDGSVVTVAHTSRHWSNIAAPIVDTDSFSDAVVARLR
jgi:hypothetical protein